MNIFKRISLLITYSKILNVNKEELLEKFNVRVDSVKRIYTVINVPDDEYTYGEQHALKLTETYLKSWLGKLDKYLITKGIKEFTDVQEITTIDQQNFLLIIRYKFLNTARIANILIGISTITTLAALISLFIKIF